MMKGILKVIREYKSGIHDGIAHERARLDIMSIIQGSSRLGKEEYSYACDQLNRIDAGMMPPPVREWASR